MVERLRRLRGPIAWLLVGATGLELLLSLIAFVYYAIVGGAVNGTYVATSQPVVAWSLLVAVAVGACGLWGRPHPQARQLSVIAAIELALFALFYVIFAIVGLLVGSGALSMVRVLVEAIAPGVLSAALFAVHAGLPDPPRPSQQYGQIGGRITDQPPVPGPHVSGQPPTWPQPGRQENPTQWQTGQSQTDQFGNPGAHFGYENPGYSAGTGSGEWQPAVQQPPQRLEPSPDQPPVGPHSQPPASDSADPATKQNEVDHGRQNGTPERRP
jgi:hypothetical protein